MADAIEGCSASCPGKVLIVGGYLVLQAGVPGLVISTTARFFSRVAWIAASVSSDGDAVSTGNLPVEIHSAQFGASWRYALRTESPCVIVPAPVASGTSPSRNVFAECALNCALAAAAAVLPPGALLERLAAAAAAGHALRVDLAADNDFYSQRAHLVTRGLPVCRESLASLPRFLPCPLGPDGRAEVHKTGLGSSAALTASLSAAALGLLGAVRLAQGEDGGAAAAPAAAPAAVEADADVRALVHAVAQVAHGLAQGKVGSGFDVCAAVYGGIEYTRVDPAVLGAAMAAAEAAGLRGGPEPDAAAVARLGSLLAAFAGVLPPGATTSLLSPADRALAEGWRFGKAPFGLPRGLALALADVAGGSETPGMVRGVLAWRDAPERREGAAGDPLAPHAPDAPLPPALLAAMAAAAEAAPGPLLWRSLAAANARVAWALAAMRRGEGSRADAAAAFGRARVLLRALGEAAGQPVEPPEQTALADATAALLGVLGAGVPGAGGHDALFAVVEGGGAREAAEALWVAWPGGGLTPLLLRDGPAAGEPGAGLRGEEAC